MKLHPPQTRGCYDGVHAKDYGPLEPSGAAIQPRPLPDPEKDYQQKGRPSVIQLDYTFVIAERAALTLVDVRSQLATTIIRLL